MLASTRFAWLLVDSKFPKWSTLVIPQKMNGTVPSCMALEVKHRARELYVYELKLSKSEVSLY